MWPRSHDAEASERPARLVPPEHLARPTRDELHDLDRGDCALLVDGYLRLLARQEAACRRLLGTFAAVFLRRKAQHRLAFTRVGDYARERLGLSARELQSTAHVATKLDGLPAIARAFDMGELSWTHTRALVQVATPETEAAWVACARALTVRALERRIGVGLRPCDDGTSSSDETVPSSDGAVTLPRDRRPAATEAIDEDDSSRLEGEPAVRIRIGSPRRVRALWRATVELARQMAGESLPLWQACEAIAAEGLTSPAACRAASRGPTSEANVTCRGGDAAVVAAADGPERRADAFPFVDWNAVADAIPASLPLPDSCETLDAFALDARMRATVAAMQRVHWQTGRLLRLVFDLRLYRLLGFRTAAHYVKERLGIGIRSAEMLVAVERVTWRAPALATAYERGLVSALRALMIAPLLSETHGAAWVGRAREVTVRRLGEEVQWALNHQDVDPLCESVAPPPAGALVMPTPAQMRACFPDEAPEIVISLPAPASVAALFETAIAAFTRRGEARWRGFERLLENVRTEWNGRPRHPDPVFARDRWRCAVPTCGARRNLHDHHVLFRSRGGDNHRTNRVALCAQHHQHGVHGGGYLRAWGEAPDGIHWELGVRRDGPPLLKLRGGRYVTVD
ncbi:MAG TPA: hypothetical protein VGK30_08235 [Candidatus Binatia bacterium]